MSWTVFYVKLYFGNSIRISLNCQWASSEMRQECRRDPHIVINDLPLGEAGIRVEDFVEVAEAKPSALNIPGSFAACHPKF